MKLPDVAKRMREIAELIQENHPNELGELFELAGEIKRRSGIRAPASSTKMTPELYEEIGEYAEANPSMSHQEIAVVFNVNHGRVSEAIKRQARIVRQVASSSDGAKSGSTSPLSKIHHGFFDIPRPISGQHTAPNLSVE